MTWISIAFRWIQRQADKNEQIFLNPEHFVFYVFFFFFRPTTNKQIFYYYLFNQTRFSKKNKLHGVIRATPVH